MNCIVTKSSNICRIFDKEATYTYTVLHIMYVSMYVHIHTYTYGTEFA